MDDQFATAMSKDYPERGLRYTKEQFEQILRQTEDYVREKPAQSLLYALVAGFILNRLPVGRILAGVARLLMVAFKPAILIYGATKLYQASQREE
jgi:glucose-6-phosphate dehydrogenase assembly protein OpcA